MKNNYMFQYNLVRQVTLVYTSVNLFNAWLNGRQLGSHRCLSI